MKTASGECVQSGGGWVRFGDSRTANWWKSELFLCSLFTTRVNSKACAVSQFQNKNDAYNSTDRRRHASSRKCFVFMALLAKIAYGSNPQLDRRLLFVQLL